MHGLIGVLRSLLHLYAAYISTIHNLVDSMESKIDSFETGFGTEGCYTVLKNLDVR